MSCTRKERNLAAENSNFPNTQYRQMPPPPHARFAYATNIPSVHTLYDFTILSYRDSTNVVFAQHSYTRRHGTYDSQQGKWQPWTSSPWVKLWLQRVFTRSTHRRLALRSPVAKKVRSRGDTVAILIDSPCDAAWWQWPFAWRTYSIPARVSFFFLVERQPYICLFLAASLFRECSLSRSCYRLYPHWQTALRTTKARDTKDWPMFFIYRTCFARSSDLSLYLIQSRKNNTNRIHVRIDRWYWKKE